MPPLRFVSYDLFGAKITPTTNDDLQYLLESHIDAAEQCVVASQNMHGLRVRLNTPALRELHALPQTHVHIDGMPLVALCRLNGIRATREHRVTLVDFIWPLLVLAERRGWRVYYVGATADVVRAGTARIAERLPTLELRAHHGYLNDAATTAEVAGEIAAFAPQLVLVGMGMGRQERWILEHLAAIAPASVMTVGACMEYIAGAVGTPPRWMGRAGLEWLYRFAEQPARFWRRYLVEPWIVLGYIAWYTAFPERARLALENAERK
jgi:N-acetylglucosaminyldiphosphoundecaprenol N-acetyl-beta-D-mannosaminyltransferase